MRLTLRRLGNVDGAEEYLYRRPRYQVAEFRQRFLDVRRVHVSVERRAVDPGFKCVEMPGLRENFKQCVALAAWLIGTRFLGQRGKGRPKFRLLAGLRLKLGNDVEEARLSSGRRLRQGREHRGQCGAPN